MAEDDVEDLLQIDRRVRNEMAATEGQRIATEIMRRLPKNRTDMEALLTEGYRLARDMSWDEVVRKYLLNDLAGAFKEPARGTYSQI